MHKDETVFVELILHSNETSDEYILSNMLEHIVLCARPESNNAETE